MLARRPERLDPDAARRFESLIERRARREPFQYVTGRQEFRGLLFHVDPRVLIPRPETEGLVEEVLAWSLPDGAVVADLGTGSGCIAVALAVERPDMRLLALDRSEEALEVARANAARHGVSGRIDLHRGDLSEPPASWLGGAHGVVSNPPYVSAAEWAGLAPEVRDHEPVAALVAGPTGAEAYGPVARAARGLLRPRGLLAVELGFGLEERAQAAAGEEGFEVLRVAPDDRGIPRILVARLR